MAMEFKIRKYLLRVTVQCEYRVPYGLVML